MSDYPNLPTHSECLQAEIQPVANFRRLGFPTEAAFAFPNIVNIEVFRGACPCECRHCPVGRTKPSHRRARFGLRGMASTLFSKIVEEISLYPGRVIRVHAVGEPLLWPDLIQALELCYKKNVKTWLFTSAVTHDRHILYKLCASADIIEVSVNSTDRTNYLATKGVDAFDLVIENLRYMQALSRQGMPVRLLVSRVESVDRAGDSAFIEFWKAMSVGHDVFIRTYHTYNNLLAEPASINTSPQRHKPCLVHWTRFNINIDGKAVVCFNELFKKNLNPSLILGDIHDQSIGMIWHGAGLSALRKAELTRDYSGLGFATALPCKNCYSCQPLWGNKQTSEHQIQHLRNR